MNWKWIAGGLALLYLIGRQQTAAANTTVSGAGYNPLAQLLAAALKPPAPTAKSSGSSGGGFGSGAGAAPAGVGKTNNDYNGQVVPLGSQTLHTPDNSGILAQPMDPGTPPSNAAGIFGSVPDAVGAVQQPGDLAFLNTGLENAPAPQLAFDPTGGGMFDSGLIDSTYYDAGAGGSGGGEPDYGLGG